MEYTFYQYKTQRPVVQAAQKEKFCVKICVYCSSAQNLAPELYAAGEAFGAALARRGHTLVYGGYNAGLMGAVAQGAAQAGAEVIGVIPEIFDQEGAAPAGCTQVVHVGSMSQRKARMEAEADAFAVLPGGIGTFDEFFETLVLKSLGQLDKPLAVYDLLGGCGPLRTLLEASAAAGYMTAETAALAPFYTDAGPLLNYLEGK